VDPLVDETGQPYAYTGDDPANFVDPSGLGLIPSWVSSDISNLGHGVISMGGCLESFGCFSPQGLANVGAGFANVATQTADGVICTLSAEQTCPTWSVGAPYPCGPQGSYQVGEAAFFGLGFAIPGGDEADAGSVASEALAASPAELSRGINVSDLNMTETVQNEAAAFAKDGTLTRPYINSPLTIQNIIDSAAPTADPGGVSSAVRWDAPGTFNGSSGTYELVIDSKTNTILHFVFTSG